MTNTEYEAASIAAALGGEKLRLKDIEIATLEAALAKAHEARREIVNFYNLNKCDDEVCRCKGTYCECGCSE